MARRKKGSVRPGKGAKCGICGMDCGKGGALRNHVEKKHGIPYSNYTVCYRDHTAVEEQWLDAGGVRIHTMVFKT